ncbi:MAG: hypothetical protein HKM93_08895 [Desulfobacteraceae bacterium]|nr:hypothetical protein [Desulfobacteraceae bacterium]
MTEKIDYEAYQESFKHLKKPGMQGFMDDPEKTEALKDAPESVRQAAFEKCVQMGIPWPFPTENDPIQPDISPDERRYVCNRYPSYAIAVGKKYAQFENGELVTDDPEIIEAVESDRFFKVCIVEG